ncbi:hypothetical protein SBA2_260073 [Acidobacteriia bacterium SbA2]|nr:hypothetical protein SBA2_260073 [Acidobacteriia bacterium SbA2]
MTGAAPGCVGKPTCGGVLPPQPVNIANVAKNNTRNRVHRKARGLAPNGSIMSSSE